MSLEELKRIRKENILKHKKKKKEYYLKKKLEQKLASGAIIKPEIDYEKEEKIIIDERTGTVVAGINILVDPIVITHGAITLKIRPVEAINLELENQVNLQDGVSLSPNDNLLNMENGKTTVANVTRALNRLGATPKEIIAILENIKRAGAIRAKLEVI